MWVSKARYQELEKKLSDLEAEIQGQRKILVKHVEDHELENRNLKEIVSITKNETYKAVQHMLKNALPQSVD